jgi:anti-anti-sigma factor
MNVSAETCGHAVILNPTGELTEDTLAAFSRVVAHQLAGDQVIDVLINLESVPFLDSAALEYLLDLQDKLAEKLGQVKLIKPDENVRKILEITRLSSTFETFDDLPAAVKAVQA